MSLQGRFLTVSFDDGLIRSARTAAARFAELGMVATFCVVTDWVGADGSKIADPYNRGRDHGQWQDWRKLEEAGHEVGSHSASHINASGKLARLLPPLLWMDLRRSHRELARQLGHRALSVSMPFNAATHMSDLIVRRIYQAACAGRAQRVYNDVANVDRYRLEAWAPEPQRDAILDGIREIPEGGWLILQFHGLDGEGWKPIASAELRSILECAASSPRLRTVTIRQMAALLEARG